MTDALARLRLHSRFASVTNDDLVQYVDGAAEALELLPTHAVYDVGCERGAFLWPLSEMGWRVGGLTQDPRALETLRDVMPNGAWTLGEPGHLDPAEPWDVVVASGSFSGLPDAAHARGVLARMAAKATVALAVLNVWDAEAPGGEGELRLAPSWFLRQLDEIGVSGFRLVHGRAPGRPGAFDVFARL